MMVPNAVALEAGFTPVKASEVKAGQNVWCRRGDYRRAEPVLEGNFVAMCGGFYHVDARVYVR